MSNLKLNLEAKSYVPKHLQQNANQQNNQQQSMPNNNMNNQYMNQPNPFGMNAPFMPNIQNMPPKG